MEDISGATTAFTGAGRLVTDEEYIIAKLKWGLGAACSATSLNIAGTNTMIISMAKRIRVHCKMESKLIARLAFLVLVLSAIVRAKFRGR